MKHRRLTVDPLEERTLLAVVAADYDDVLVNEYVGTEQQGTIGAQSVATDHDGDFAVVWERFDPVINPATGNPVIDPATGDPMLDANIYARYFTDEVQRLTLPKAIADDPDGNDLAGSFSLTYGGNEVQKIAITATYRPYTDGGWWQDYIAGAVTFGFDVNDNGIVGPGETTTVFFNEGTQEFTEIAADFQTHLQGLGGALTDVTVRGMNPHEYIVEFGDLSMGLDQPEITVESVNFTSGFYPAVITSTVREPIVIGPILVSATNPAQTANAVEEAFFFTSTDYVMGPIDFPPRYLWADPEDERVWPPEGPYSQPDVLRTAAPGVSVTPVWEQVYDSLGNPILDANGKPLVAPSTTVFDITFDGSNGVQEGPAGKQDHPLLVVESAEDQDGNDLSLSPEIDVKTLKEPSPEFRVNPAEPDNPFTQLPDRYSQRRPDVAMDSDGEFIITWESVVPDVVQYGTVADVFARRFAPVGIVPAGEEEFYVDTDFDGIADTPIQGVKDLDSGFRVNTSTTGAQGQPAVGTDDEGNFVIAWGSGTEGFSQFDPYQVFQGQDLGYFNGIRAQQFDRFGEPVGDEFLVNAEDTEIHYDPYVAVSHDGHSVITWSNTNDEQFIDVAGGSMGVFAKVFNPDGTVRRNQFAVAGGGGSAAAFDDNNNYAITWSVGADRDSPYSGVSTGVRAVMYNITGGVIRSTFRANSAHFDPSTTTLWPFTQWLSEVALDADGEMVVSYEGFGPDVSDELYEYGYWKPDWQERREAYRQALVDRFYKPENADLLQFFDPAVETFPISGQYYDASGSYVNLGTTRDIDTDIENVLIRALTRTSPAATDAQLGRLRALIEEVAGLLEGEANGVMFTSLDADPSVPIPDSPTQNFLHSDNVANNERDGHTQRYILTIPTTSTGGSFQIRLDGSENRTINPVYNNQVLNVYETRNEIFAELTNATRTGVQWDSRPDTATLNDNSFEGPIQVRVVSTGFGWIDSEITARENTPWEYTVSPDQAVYEIVVQGERHNDYISMGLRANQINPDTERPLVQLFMINYPDEGTTQTAASIGMEQDGDFVMVWTQNEEFTTGGVSNRNIYYRRFTETTDTAGPKVTDLVNQYDQGMANDDRMVGPVQYVVLTFDEELMTGDPLANPDSVLNPNNFILYRGDQEIPFGVAKVEFGMNKAADLAGADDGFGGMYPSTWTRSNKWEAVLILDADGGLVQGLPALGTGRYTVEARVPRPEDGVSGLRDKAGNALGFSGYRVAGQNFQRSFVVTLADPDVPISDGAAVPYTSGNTHPETPGAVAVDADGDHVVVWTGHDFLNRDRIYMRVFDAAGNPAQLPVLDPGGNPTGFFSPCPVIEVTPETDFFFDQQRHGNVAIDRDGDFVVTWTNYRDGDADVYARRFGLLGLDSSLDLVFDSEAFQVNTYTDDVQKWSDVAMDLDGDFAITWSSYGQEAAEGALGTGWGIYARQYDAFGQPLAPEFRVNVTTAGNQQGSSVAMSGEGDFVVAWTSDQNGIGDDIVAREFFADGSPKVTPLTGEILVNDTQVGDQRFPDVAMRLDGENYVVTWTDSAADKSGTSVWAELSRPLPNRYVDPDGVAISATHRLTLNVTDNLTISDVNIQLGLLVHQRLEDLRISLESPDGTVIQLFEDLPRPFPDGSRPPGNSMVGTIFDDEAQKAIDITDSAGGAVPSYNDSFVPEQRLDAFIGEGTQGVWTLIIEDRQPQNNLVGSLSSLSPEIGAWSLIIEASDDSADSFLVNTTREGHQMFSSAAMDNDGAFAITWSGNGNQQFQEDTSGHGVFYQRYDEFGVALGLEQRANSPQNVEGDQWISSIDMDASGNAVIAWTGPQLDSLGNPLAETDIYTFVSVNDAAQLDDDGPLVTDLLWNEDRVLQGDVLDTLQNGVPVEVTELTVVFSEDMSLATTLAGDPDLISIENPNSWVLTRNGSEIIGGVTDVDFAYNEVTRRYEAVVSIDGNGINVGTPGLPDGEYVLAIKDDMTDVSVFFDPNEPDRLVPGNRLDGDADGQPASSPTTLGYSAYLHRFVVGGGPANGPEVRVNSDDYVPYQQTFSEPAGTGLAREESTRSVAVDHDGDYVVVWTSYGQTPGEPASGDVYFAMFDRYDNPITKDFSTGEVLEQQVNTYTEGHQRNAAVAMDADGEFVIVWESEGEDPDGSWGIYARRYDSMGQPLVSDTNRSGAIDSGDTDLPFRVNTEFTRNQLNPSVAMDDFGGFVVVWATAGQDFSFFNDVYGQRYSRFGIAQGLELQVNTFDLPGVQPPPGGSFEINPAVGMSGPSGNFVVAWDVVTAQQNGVVTDSVIAARRFAADGSPQGGEFQADTGPGSGGGDIFRVARNPQVAVDDLSGFIVVWESYMGNVVAAYDVFFQQFNSGGGSVASGQINMPETLGAGEFADDQVNPSVAIDADGDFAVVWNGQGAQPDPLNPNNADLVADSDIEGVFIRQYYAAGDSNGDGIPDLAPAPVTVQSRVNRTEGGIQQFPSIGMEPDGDMIVVWSGRGVGDIHGIFARRYDEQTDTAGPMATELRLEDGTLVPDNPNDDPIDSTDTLVVVFDEHMWTTGPDSVTNPENWELRRNGIEIRDVITGITYSLNPGTNKWEAVITFDRDLSAGDYTLTALHPVPDIPETDPDEGQSGLRDAQGNPLALDGFEPGGADVIIPFFVSPLGGDDQSVTSLTGGRTYAEARGATAVDSDGDYVVVYTANIAGVDRVLVRLFDADGTTVTDPFQVSTVPGEQRYATVDLDADGDFVVTWTNYDGGDADVYARLFSSEVRGGLPTPMSGAFRVNAYTDYNQKWSDVALDPDGDFVVTWSSYGQEDGGNLGSGYGVYARRFNRFGFPLGGEFQVNVTTGGNQRNAAVDVADGGSFVLAWTSDQNGVGDDVIARLFEADGKPKIGPLGGELLVNAGSTSGDQSYPDVAITPSGEDFMVIWTSAHDDGSGDGIFARSVNVPLLEEQADPEMEYVWTGSQDFWLGNNVRAQIAVPFDIPINNFTIADANVLVDADHPFTYDVKLTLESPAGTAVVLVENEPDPVTTSSDFAGTIFDDESTIAITDPPPAAVGPYNDPLGYQPEDLVNYGVGFGLDAFDGERSSGTWTLLVQDTVDRGFPTFQDEIARRGTLNEWRLTLTRQPAMGATFQVNTSTLGNQNFGSIAMNRRGGFTVAWNGRGDQPRQEDTSGSGVFFRQFAIDGTPVGGETRANYIVDGDQRYATIGGDAAGGFTMVWTGDLALGITDVYRALSADFVSNRDLDGPVVSDVLLSDGTPVLNGDTVATGVTELVVAFSEVLSVRDNDDMSLVPGPGPDSILNPDNWVLQRNGSTVPGAIQKVSFALNPVTRKYEAVVSLDASSIGGGTTGLPEGDYVLVVMDTVNDLYDFEPGEPYFMGNALDGDFDGSPGTSAAASGPSGYSHEFHVIPGSPSSVEYRVNDGVAAPLQQTFSEPLGTGYGREQSTHSLAVDHDGDYVAVWTSYGQDDPGDFNGGGIYFRMFDRNDEEIKGETPVNTVTDGNQRNAAVAMDADGEFVVVWESENDNVDGSWGIYGRMYNSVGEPLGDQFLINTTLQNDQLNPSVAMDDFGNFVVVWAAKGQQFSYFNDVVGQLFYYDGQTIGSEFIINSTGVPGTGTGPGNVDLNPAVAMDDVGNFVVAWDQITAQQSGVVTDGEIRARMYDTAGVAAAAEFAVGSGIGEPGDPDIGRTARNPQVTLQDARDADGDGQLDPGAFIVVWESTVGATYDVFFEQFDATGASLASGQVNEVAPDDPGDDPIQISLAAIYGGGQVNPSVGVDADGDFAVVWNGQGARPDALNPGDPDLASERDVEGVFVRSYQSNQTAPEAVTVQSRVNRTESGIQQFPTIGMEPDGDRVVVWSGNGIGDRNGIFARRYNEATDTAGPKVSDITTISGERIGYGGQLTEAPNYIVVVFDEEMMAGDPTLVADSVLNTANYSLVKDGAVLVGGIRSIQFGLNKASEIFPGVEDTNKWEAVIELDGNGTGAGVTALPAGQYEIIISGTLRDAVGNPLYSSGLNPYGEDTSGLFNVAGFTSTTEEPVNPVTGGDQVLVGDTGAEYAPRAVASDGDGEFVVVWTDATSGGVYARVYNDLRWSGTQMQRISTGPVPDDAFQVTDDPTAMFASVARDADGDFVVTWEQNDGTAASPDWNVWARRYDAVGRPFDDAFLVNSVTEGEQRYAAVAMDVDGDFVVTWQSNDPAADLEGRARDDDGYGIYAQRFSPSGQRLGGADEVQVLTFSASPVGSFTLFWDGDDDPSTPNVTAPIQIDGNPAGSVDQIEAQLNVLAGDVNRVQVQATSLTEVIVYFVDQGAARNQEQIVVANTSFLDPVSDVAASTLIEGFGGEFLVNDTTENNQMHPSVAMSAEGDFVVSWTSFGQDGDAANESNIYAKKFASNDAFRYPANSAGARDYDYGARVQYPDAYFAVSADNPDNHIVNPGSGYDGVVTLIDPFTGGSGTGSLLRTGRHILTAAHVVDFGGGIPTPLMLVQFDTPSGPTFMTATEIYIHPGWNGDILNANDLAIIVLPEEAPAEAERYDIYRSSDELNQRVDMVGYGVAGQGAEQFYDGQKRIEWNVYEAYGDDLNGLSTLDFLLGIGSFDVPAGKLLVYDFDSGLRENDALGMVLGIGDLGLGEEEGTSSHGDSGGPAYINGLIAGVVSGGSEYLPADSDAISFNVSFGTVGFHTRVSAYADWIDMITQSTSGEFLVNDVPTVPDPTTGLPVPQPTGNQKWSSAAMDADGDFAITWTDELRAPDPNEHLNVMAKRFNADATEFEVTDPTTGLPAPLGEFQVNTAGDASRSQAAMDVDGDFVIVWANKAQRYAKNDLVGDPSLGPNGELGGNLTVFTGGPGLYASVAVDHTGDTVFVREGYDSLNPLSLGIFYKRSEAAEDDAGPMVADVINVIPTGTEVALQQLTNGVVVDEGPTTLIVSFSEDLIDGSSSLIDSITNRSNWILTRNGQVLAGGVAAVEFGLNQTSSSPFPILPEETNKYEAVLTLDGDPSDPGNQPLGPGTYMLRIRSFVEDQFNNRLDGDYDGSPDGDFRRTFVVSQEAGGPALDGDRSRIGDPDPNFEDKLVNFNDAGDQDSPAVASDADGNYVVAWVETADVLDATGAVIGIDSNIKARRYDRFGNPIGGEFIVNSYRTGDQLQPAVAMNAFGSFVVTWSGEGEVDDQGTIDLVGIFGRVFDAFGQPLGEQFMVNQSGDARRYDQTAPSVAMDERGDFAVTWTSYGQDGDQDGVYARRYDYLGEAKGGEFRVNTTVLNRQANSDIAMDPDGNFVIVWSAFEQPGDGSEWAVVGRRYNAAGTPLSGEFLVNTRTLDDQTDAHVGMDADGNFVVAWASDIQDGSGWGVYARRYGAAGGVLSSAFRVNQTTLYWQYQPDVSMAGDGDFVVTWTTVGQDNSDAEDRGIYARAYDADGGNYVDPDTGLVVGEFQVNANVIGNQQDSAVALDADGDFAVVWTGPDDYVDVGDPTDPADDVTIASRGVYHRHFRVNDVSGGGTGGGAITGSIGGVYFADGENGGTSTVLSLQGTPGDDTFEFLAGPTAATSVVLVNGVRYAIHPEVLSIRFDGQGGHDEVVIKGTALNETIDLYPDHAAFSASRYNVSVANVEWIFALGGGGTDFAILHDDPDGKDTLKAWPGIAKLYGDGFYTIAKSFSHVHAYGTEGSGDMAVLYDDPHSADTLKAGPSEAKLYGDGFYNKVAAFDSVYAYATAGGGDMAVLYDDPDGKDTFKAWPTEAKLYGDGFFNRVNSFSSVYAYATEGNGDLAVLYDDPDGVDTFKAWPNEAKLYPNGGGFFNRAKGFGSVYAYATEGGEDVAILYDTPGVRDTFKAWPSEARLYGEGFYNKANAFGFVHAYATEGDGDVAVLYDDPGGQDTLKAWPNEAKLYGGGFFNRAKGFYSVYAYATPGGNDVAKLYDSPSKDTLVATPESVKLYNGVYYNRASSFANVYAYSTNGGYDTAYLNDSALEEYPDHLEADANWARLSNELLGYAYLASDFEEVVATLSNASDTEDVDTAALDFLFSTERTW